MKIRNGFVSNSSTSSFICIMEKDLFIKTLDNFSERAQYIIKYFSQDKKIWDKELQIIEWTIGNDDDFEDIDERSILHKELIDDNDNNDDNDDNDNDDNDDNDDFRDECYDTFKTFENVIGKITEEPPNKVIVIYKEY